MNQSWSHPTPYVYLQESACSANVGQELECSLECGKEENCGAFYVKEDDAVSTNGVCVLIEMDELGMYKNNTLLAEGTSKYYYRLV